MADSDLEEIIRKFEVNFLITYYLIVIVQFCTELSWSNFAVFYHPAAIWQHMTPHSSH